MSATTPLPAVLARGPRGQRSPLRAFLFEEPQFALLEPLGCGWGDGGCAILADALAAWLGPYRARLAMVADARGAVQHVAVRTAGDMVVDADGPVHLDDVCDLTSVTGAPIKSLMGEVIVLADKSTGLESTVSLDVNFIQTPRYSLYR